MSKIKESYYKDTLHKEVDKIPENEVTFMVQLINIIREYMKKNR